MAAGHGQHLAHGQACDAAGVMAHHHPALPAAYYGQWHFQLAGLAGAGVWHAPINADFRGRVEPQAQAIADLVQTMLQVGLQAVRVKPAKQCLAGKILTRSVQVAELFALAQGAASRGQAVDQTKKLSRADHPAVSQGQHRRVEHHHPAIQLRATQGRVQMQHPAQ